MSVIIASTTDFGKWLILLQRSQTNSRALLRSGCDYRQVTNLLHEEADMAIYTAITNGCSKRFSVIYIFILSFYIPTLSPHLPPSHHHPLLTESKASLGRFTVLTHSRMLLAGPPEILQLSDDIPVLSSTKGKVQYSQSLVQFLLKSGKFPWVELAIHFLEL